MALTYVGGYATAASGSTASWAVSLTSLTGGSDSAPQAGDYVVVVFGVASSSDRTLAATGYTQLAELYANDSNDTNMYVGYKLMGATPDTSVTLTCTGTSAADSRSVAIHVYRGANAPTGTVTATGTNSILADPPAITPTVADSLILVAGSGASTAGTRTYGASYASNFVTTGIAGGLYDTVIGLGSVAWTSGTYNPAAFTFSTADSSANSWAAVSLIVEPSVPNQLGDPPDVSTGVPTVGDLLVTQQLPPVTPIAYTSSGFVGSTGTHTISFSGMTYIGSESVQADDSVYVYITSANSSAPLTVVTSGYTQLVSHSAADTISTYSALYVKTMGATPDTDLVIDGSGSGTYALAASVIVLRGVADYTLAPSTGTNTALADPAAVLVGANPALSVAFGASSGNGTATYSSSSYATFTSAAGNDSNDAVVGAGLYTVDSGTVNPPAFSYSADSGSYAYTAVHLVAYGANLVSLSSIDTGAVSIPVVTAQQPTVPFVVLASGSAGYPGASSGTRSFDLSSLTFQIDSTLQEGDLLFAYLTQADAVYPDMVSAGWTLDTSITASNTISTSARLYYKYMGATPDTSVEFTASGDTTVASAIAVLAVRNTSAAAPLRTTATFTAINTGIPDPSPVYIADIPALVLVFANTGANSTAVYTAPELGSFTTSVGVDTDRAVVGAGFFKIARGTQNPSALGFSGSSSSGSTGALTVVVNAINYVAATAVETPAPAVFNPTVGKPGPNIIVVGQAAIATATNSRAVALTDLTGGIDTVPSVDDTVLVMLTASTGSTTAINFTVSGYTQLAYDIITAGAEDLAVAVYAKRLTAVDTSVTVSQSGATEFGVKVFVLRNVVPTFTPDTATYWSSTAADYIDPPAITATVPGSLILSVGAKDGNVALVMPSSTWSERTTAGGNTYGFAFYPLADGVSAFNPDPWTPLDNNESIALTTTLAPDTNASASVSGVEATGEVGSVEWPTTVYITGVSATAALGSVTVTGAGTVSVTGIAATSALGSVVVTGHAVISAVGTTTTASLGTVTVTADSVEYVTGLQATVYGNSVVTSAAATVELTGVDATGSVGAVDITIGYLVSGVEATGYVGSVTVALSANVSVTGVEGVGAVSSVNALGYAVITASGTAATTTLGDVIVYLSIELYTTGVVAYGYTSPVLVWGQINTNQAPNYANVDSGQIPGYSDVTSDQSTTWTQIAS